MGRGDLYNITSFLTVGPKMKGQSYLACVLSMTSPCLPWHHSGQSLASVKTSRPLVMRGNLWYCPPAKGTNDHLGPLTAVLLPGMMPLSLMHYSYPCVDSASCLFYTTCGFSEAGVMCLVTPSPLHFCIGKMYYHSSSCRRQMRLLGFPTTVLYGLGALPCINTH